MKLPWLLKKLIHQLLGGKPGSKGVLLVAWLEGPAGACLNAASSGAAGRALDDAEKAITDRLGSLLGGQ